MTAFTRKLAEGLYGGHQPGNVALAVALGVLAGALAGANVSWLVVLLAAMVFNVHTRFFLSAWMASLLSAFLARECLENTGRFLLDKTPLGQAIGQLGDGLLLALLGWDQYVVIGGAAVGMAVGFCGALVFYQLTARLNRRWQAVILHEGEVNGPPEGPRPVGPALICLWYGSTSYERTLHRKGGGLRLRRCGVPSALAASLAMAAVAWSLAGSLAERELWRQFSAYSGAEITAEATELSLWTGRFVVHGLHVSDHRAPQRDRLQVAVAKGVLSPGLLLRGHLDIDKLVLERIVHGGSSPETVDDIDVWSRATVQYQRDDAVPRSDELLIQDGLRHWPIVCRRLGSLARVVLAVEQLSRAEKIGCFDAATPGGKHRSDLGTPRPWVAVRQLRITNLPTHWNLGSKSIVELKNLSSGARLCARAPELKIVLPKFGAEIELAFDAERAGMPHTLSATAYEVPLPQRIDGERADRTLSVREGRARLSGQGACDAQRLDVRLQIDVESLAAEVSSNGPLAGIEAETWNEGLSRLGSFHAELALSGPWSSPRLIISRAQLVGGFRRQLSLAGARDVADAIDRQLAANELRTGPTFVVQASASESQVIADPPGLCDFSEAALAEPDANSQTGGEIASGAAAHVAAASMLSPYQPYPTTSLDESADSPPTISPPPAPPAPPAPVVPAVRRPLPGPVNMAVGRDPSCISTSSLDHSADLFGASQAPRENVLSRWSRSLRERFGHGSAGATPSDEEPSDEEPSIPPAADSPSPRQPVSAAASDAWYNRLLR